MTLSEVYPEDQKVVYIKIGTTGKVFLSISTLNRHIIPRHRLHWIELPGFHTPFLTETPLIDLIAFVLREGNIVDGEERKAGNYSVEYHFAFYIGCDKFGVLVNVVRVSLNPSGRIITAYPHNPCKSSCVQLHSNTSRVCFKDHITSGLGER